MNVLIETLAPLTGAIDHTGTLAEYREANAEDADVMDALDKLEREGGEVAVGHVVMRVSQGWERLDSLDHPDYCPSDECIALWRSPLGPDGLYGFAEQTERGWLLELAGHFTRSGPSAYPPIGWRDLIREFYGIEGGAQ